MGRSLPLCQSINCHCLSPYRSRDVPLWIFILAPHPHLVAVWTLPLCSHVPRWLALMVCRRVHAPHLSWPTPRSNRCQDEESGALTFSRQARQISQTNAGPARPHRNGRLAGRSPGMIHEKPHRSSHPTVRGSLRSGPAPRQTSVDSVSEDLSSSLLHSCGMHQALSPLRVYVVGHYMALSAPGAVGQGDRPSTEARGRRKLAELRDGIGSASCTAGPRRS